MSTLPEARPRPRRPAPPVLPRLLKGIDGTGGLVDLDAHLDEHGPLPDLGRRPAEAIIGELDRSGLRGHGGAAFPTARKLASVAARRGERYVVVNATEGEPLSRKDRTLLREAPHLVLDGAALAARAVGARDVFIAFCENVRGTGESLGAAVEQRSQRRIGDPRFQLVPTPEGYLTGQETALVNFLNGGAPLPTFGLLPFQRGIRQRATLVQNAETLAHVALILRHGAEWFRALGATEDPGSALVTVAGAFERPGVYEIEQGTPLSEVVALAAATEEIQAFLLGGYFGTWVDGRLQHQLRLSNADLRQLGASLGAGILFALGRSACPVAETARVLDWFATQAAGQCGPCVNGLGSISDTVWELAHGTAGRHGQAELSRWSEEVQGRGACRHPDGAVRFLGSALTTFAEEFADHARHGPCERCRAPDALPVR